MPLSDAADRSGVTVRWLRDAIDCGELIAYNRSHGENRPRWFVKLTDVQKYVSSKKVELI